MRVFSLAFLTIIIGSSVANATCEEDILKFINYDRRRSYNHLTEEQINTASFCVERYKKDGGEKSSEVEFGFKMLKLAGDGSETNIHEEQDKRCGSKYGREFFDALGITESQLVSPSTIDALKACHQDGGLHLTRLTSIQGGFSADFRWSGVGSVFVRPPDIRVVQTADKPAAAVSCRLGHGDSSDVKKTFRLDANSQATIQCTRTAYTVENGGHTYDFYPEALVTVSSDGGSVAIPLIEISIPRENGLLAELEKRVNDLSAQIDHDKAKISELENTKAALAKRASDSFVVYQAVDRGSIGGGGVVFMPDRVANSCVGNWGPFKQELFKSLCGARRAEEQDLWSVDGPNCGRTLFIVRCFD